MTKEEFTFLFLIFDISIVFILLTALFLFFVSFRHIFSYE